MLAEAVKQSLAKYHTNLIDAYWDFPENRYNTASEIHSNSAFV